MKRLDRLLVRHAALLCFVSAAMGAEATPHATASPVAIVRAFYIYHFAHDMAFTEASVRAKSEWLAPELVDLCQAYFRKPVRRDEVPDVDGDPFTDSQEYPKSFRVGQPRISETMVRVPVALSWPDRHRTIRVQLKLLQGSWRITDITYGGVRSLRALLSPGS